MAKFEGDYFKGGGSNYREGYSQETLVPFVKRNFKLMKKYANMKKSSRILELGCASGFFLRECDKAGMVTYGLDISKYATSQARKNSKAKVVCQRADVKLPFKDDFFDTVAMFVTIEHLKNPEMSIKEAMRVLKKGGTFVVTTNSKWSFYRFLEIFDKRFRDDETHIALKSVSDWKKIMERTGFKVREAKTYHFPGQARIKKITGLDIDNIVPWFKEGILLVADK